MCVVFVYLKIAGRQITSQLETYKRCGAYTDGDIHWHNEVCFSAGHNEKNPINDMQIHNNYDLYSAYCFTVCACTVLWHISFSA